METRNLGKIYLPTKCWAAGEKNYLLPFMLQCFPIPEVYSYKIWAPTPWGEFQGGERERERYIYCTYNYVEYKYIRIHTHTYIERHIYKI